MRPLSVSYSLYQHGLTLLACILVGIPECGQHGEDVIAVDLDALNTVSL